MIENNSQIRSDSNHMPNRQWLQKLTSRFLLFFIISFFSVNLSVYASASTLDTDLEKKFSRWPCSSRNYLSQLQKEIKNLEDRMVQIQKKKDWLKNKVFKSFDSELLALYSDYEITDLQKILWQEYVMNEIETFKFQIYKNRHTFSFKKEKILFDLLIKIMNTNHKKNLDDEKNRDGEYRTTTLE